MIRRAIAGVVLLIAILGAGFWVLTEPQPISPDQIPNRVPDLANGKRMFAIGGCASCHAVPGAKGEDRLVLAGGLRLKTPFGTFLAPNISPDPDSGVGRWTQAQFIDAVVAGVSPDGRHYYPAFPYGSYARMSIDDVIDLHAYVMTLPPSTRRSKAHELGFPFTIRRGLGLWKRLYVDDEPVAHLAITSPELELGRYLVEGPGHCAECHTVRNSFGGLDRQGWLAGAPSPDGPGRIPNITSHETGLARWSIADIAEYLRSGFTPDYDTAGGEMVEVVENTSQLSDEDRHAIASYLKAVPPLPAYKRP